jgi:hypothetical protein
LAVTGKEDLHLLKEVHVHKLIYFTHFILILMYEPFIRHVKEIYPAVWRELEL